MADKKISALTGAATPLTGTEVLPIVQSGATVKVANNDLRPKQIQSNATSGVLQVAGPAAASTRVMTTPDANFVAARTDAGQTFTGNQVIETGTSTTNITLFAALDGGNDYQANFAAARTGTAGGARLKTKRNTGTGGVGWVAQVTTDNAAENAGTYVDAVEITNLSNLVVSTGNIVIGTAGKGIDFSANTHAAGMTSELLNDYEEGTWTPVIAGSSSAGTANYVAQAGSYTKIGRTVYFQVYLSWDSGTGTGDLYVSGLPFLSSGAPYGVASTAYQLNIALSALSYSTGGYVLSSNTSVRMMQSTIAGGGVSSIPYDAAGEFMMSGSYFV